MLPKNKTYHNGCKNEPKNPFFNLNPYLNKTFNEKGYDTPYIMIVSRGECYFAIKAMYAQNLKADALVVIDSTVKKQKTKKQK